MGDRWDPVPDWLMREVLEPVLSDLQRPTPVALDLGLSLDGEFLWFAERGQSGAAGMWIAGWSTPSPRLVVACAGWLQEQFFPETRGAWGEARPECPGHPHPASAVELDGEAWWVCPADGWRVAKIGTLGDGREQFRPG